METANWPTKSGEYKVVQINFDNQPYLRLRKLDADVTHAGILEDFLRLEARIEFETTTSMQRDIPRKKGERYELVGAGRSEIFMTTQAAWFYGKSFDYGFGINEEHLHQIKRLGNWSLGIRD